MQNFMFLLSLYQLKYLVFKEHFIEINIYLKQRVWNRYLDFVIDPRLHKQYCLPAIKKCNIIMLWSMEDISLISQKKKKKDLKSYDIIRKIATCQGNDYTTGWLSLFQKIRK